LPWALYPMPRGSAPMGDIAVSRESEHLTSGTAWNIAAGRSSFADIVAHCITVSFPAWAMLFLRIIKTSHIFSGADHEYQTDTSRWTSATDTCREWNFTTFDHATNLPLPVEIRRSGNFYQTLNTFMKLNYFRHFTSVCPLVVMSEKT
jgi:hypothetical protein